MAEGRMDNEDRMLWNHTATLLAKLHNVNCARESDYRKPEDFHPYHEEEVKEWTAMTPEDRAKIKGAFRRG